MDLVKQVSQACRFAVAGNVFVAVNGLAKQSDFFTALIGKDFGFFKNLFGSPALLRTSGHRDDAVRAKFVAADLDSQKRLERRGAHCRIAEWVKRFVASFDVVDFSVGSSQADGCVLATLRTNLFQQVGDLLKLSRPDNDIDIRRPIKNQLLIFLSHAAHDADDLLGIVFLFFAKTTQRTVGFVFGLFTD